MHTGLLNISAHIFQKKKNPFKNRFSPSTENSVLVGHGNQMDTKVLISHGEPMLRAALTPGSNNSSEDRNRNPSPFRYPQMSFSFGHIINDLNILLCIYQNI